MFSMKKFQFDHIVAAGTWDHFHQGHEDFLSQAFKISKRVTVAITRGEMARVKEYPSQVEPLGERARVIKKFLKTKKLSKRAKIAIIKDIYGPAITDKTLQGILVTGLTFSGGKEVNHKRQQLSLPPLQLIKVPFTKTEDKIEISSRRIRAGEIDRKGEVYFKVFENNLLLPRALRAELAGPFGELIKQPSQVKLNTELKGNKSPVVAVGDITSKFFLENSLEADLFIVDFLVGRKRVFSSLEEIGFKKSQRFVPVNNKPGTITRELVSSVRSSLKQQNLVILVKGEEDLAVLPVVLALPLGSRVVYGQPNQGLVVVQVTEEKKRAAYNLAKKFTI